MPKSANQLPMLFDPERMRRYPVLVLVICAICAVLLIATSKEMVDLQGKPLGYDFITFWSTSGLTLEGSPEAAFDAATQVAAQRQTVPGSSVVYYWHYPPTFQLLSAPLALLPYALAFTVFTGLGLAAYLFGLRPLMRQPHALLLLASFPAAILCIFNGQNSLLTAGLLASAIWLSERGLRGQWMAGICIGLLAYKPQFGVLIPLALVVAGQWRMFAAAAFTTLAFATTATLLLGADLWTAFLDNLSFVDDLIDNRALQWEKMPSAFIFLRMWGAPQSVAFICQVALALALACAAIVVWRRCGMTRLAWAVLVVLSLMTPHYIFDYELALLAIPVAIVLSDMSEHGATRTEKFVLLALAVLSGMTAPVSGLVHTQVGFLVLLGVLIIAARRALAASSITNSGIDVVRSTASPLRVEALCGAE